MRDGDQHLMPAATGLPVASAESGPSLLPLDDAARQQRALRLLSDVVKFVYAHGNEPAMPHDICHLIASLGGCPVALIAWREPSGALCLRGGAGPAWDATAAFDLAGSGRVASLARRAMGSGKPALCDRSSHATAGDGADDELAQVAALLALPLRGDQVVDGVLIIGAGATGAFTAVEAQVFSEIARELGLSRQGRHLQLSSSPDESGLRFSGSYVRAVLSSPYTGVLVIDEDDRVALANEAFCALFGLAETPVELEGLRAEQLYERMRHAYADADGEWARVREIVARGEPVRGDEVRIKGGRTFLRDFTPIRADGIARGRIWHQREITERKMYEARVERLAFYDAVTGLPNRRLLFERLEQARVLASTGETLVAVGVLDLDRFKGVNDTVGHAGGDHVLAEASSRVAALLRDADVLARFGGDEFGLVISGLDSKEQLDAISRCILQALRAPFDLQGEQLYLSASIGWTLFPLDRSDADGLLRHADMAMYAAKEDGKDRGLLYEAAMEQEQLRLQAMRERMAQALVQSRLQLLFQPIVYIDGLPGLHGVAGMEALLRLRDGEEGLIEPTHFMHVLDDPQLARPIGRYVLDEALKQCQAWMHAGVSIPVSINISTRHLLHPAFFADIDTALDSYPGVMDVGFGIEVTETGPTMDHARAKVVIEECRRRGIRVGLDDFGTGTASLSHIQKLDIEHIKLDQSFVSNILSDERNVAIAAGVITTARMLAKTVIAEGVETPEQGDLLALLGCHQLQGFSISRPMPSDAVAGWVAGWVPPASWARQVGERRKLQAAQPRAGS
jgi:diguanylate cyclase (GGDEF)-like protein/PAS domain S-box-containing protein